METSEFVTHGSIHRFKIFKNFEGNDIAGSIYGAESDPLVIFLHGGGQTRFACHISKKVCYYL